MYQAVQKADIPNFVELTFAGFEALPDALGRGVDGFEHMWVGCDTFQHDFTRASSTSKLDLRKYALCNMITSVEIWARFPRFSPPF